MVYHEYKVPESACAGRLFWIWGAYALGMLWLWNGLTAVGLPPSLIWLVAAAIGGCLLACTLEI